MPNHSLVRLATTTALCAGVVLAQPAAGLAKPPPHATATPDQLRTYYSSGAYLNDVMAAVAPAKAFLAERMDQIDSQRMACSAAGISPGTSSAAAATRAASLTAATPVATTTLTLRRDVLRRAGVKLSATGVKVTGGRRLVLPARSAVVTATTARVVQGGTIVLRRGAHRVVLRSVEIRLTRSSVSVTALINAKRTTVMTSAAGPRRPTFTTAGARVVAAPLRLTHAAARGLRSVGLRAGRIAIVTVSIRKPAVPGAPAFQPTATTCRAVPSKPAMVLDIDETALSAYLAGGDPGGGAAGQSPELLGTAVALPPVLDLFRYARSRGVGVDFITARVTPQSVNTGTNLDGQGYGDRIGVTYRSSTSEDPGQYKHDARQALQEQQGYTILANVGDQCSDLYDGQAERSFKLPNTFYITAGKQDASCDQDG